MTKERIVGARVALCAVASAALLTMGTASTQAADLGDYDGSLKDTGPVYEPAPLWAGFYVGAHAGYGWSEKDWTLVRNAGMNPSPRIGEQLTSHDADGWLGGLQAGVNAQSGNLVYGAEVELSWTGIDGRGTWTGQQGTLDRDGEVEVNWLGTVAGRLGMTFDRTLVYGKLGLALANEDYNHTAERTSNPPRDFNGDDTRGGWLIGAGIEHAFGPNWSLKAEYNYIDFGEEEVTVREDDRRAIFDIDQDMHVFKVGLNYRFNWEREVEPLK